MSNTRSKSNRKRIEDRQTVSVLHQPPVLPPKPALPQATPSALPPIHEQPEAGQRFLLDGISWEGYDKILDALSEHHVRITYDEGRLELMSPLPPHELYKVAFYRLFLAISGVLGIPFRGLGSTTLKRKDLAKGLEPDECYYFASAAKIRNWRALDLNRDPPPDLAVEIESTKSALDRLGIYAALGIPELWRFDGSELRAYRLRVEAQSYEQVEVSPNLPFLPLNEVVPILQESLDAPSDHELFQSLQRWIAQRVLPLYREANPSKTN
jgi:Uma2 family endonuclease